MWAPTGSPFSPLNVVSTCGDAGPVQVLHHSGTSVLQIVKTNEKQEKFDNLKLPVEARSFMGCES